MSTPLGPNTRLIERFLDRLAQFDPADFATVVQTWRDRLRRTDAWCMAEDAVGDAIARTRRDGQMWLLQDRIYAIFRGAPWYGDRPPNAPPAPAEVASQYLATTAAVALLVADALGARDLATLYAPFTDTIPLGDIAWSAGPAIESRRPNDGGSMPGAERSYDAERWPH